MKEALFVCKQCGHQFVVKVLEPGEAEAKRITPSPVRCPECGGGVERVE